MFKKMLAMALVCLSFSAFANVDSKIAPIFDELEYKLAVEWDQKDQTFYNNAVANFESELATLAEQGVQPSEVLAYLQSNIKDQKVANELTDLVGSIDMASMSLEDTKSLIKEYVDGMNNTGANYSGYYSYSYGWYYVAFGGFAYYYYYYSYSYTYYYY